MRMDYKAMRFLLFIILILLLIAVLPTWPYSTAWGYYPSGGLGLILLIVLLVVYFARAIAADAAGCRSCNHYLKSAETCCRQALAR